MKARSSGHEALLQPDHHLRERTRSLFDTARGSLKPSLADASRAPTALGGANIAPDETSHTKGR